MEDEIKSLFVDEIREIRRESSSSPHYTLLTDLRTYETCEELSRQNGASWGLRSSTILSVPYHFEVNNACVVQSPSSKMNMYDKRKLY